MRTGKVVPLAPGTAYTRVFYGVGDGFTPHPLVLAVVSAIGTFVDDATGDFEYCYQDDQGQLRSMPTSAHKIHDMPDETMLHGRPQ